MILNCAQTASRDETLPHPRPSSFFPETKLRLKGFLRSSKQNTAIATTVSSNQQANKTADAHSRETARLIQPQSGDGESSSIMPNPAATKFVGESDAPESHCERTKCALPKRIIFRAILKQTENQAKRLFDYENLDSPPLLSIDLQRLMKKLFAIRTKCLWLSQLDISRWPNRPCGW